MKVRFELEATPPRWLRGMSRRALTGFLLVSLLVGLGGSIAWAINSVYFTDVTNPPYSDDVVRSIDAIRTAGITLGCNPPTNDRFCPQDPVTRWQMAMFLHRGLGRVGLGVTPNAVNAGIPLNTTTALDLAVVQIKPGDVPTGTAFVEVNAGATAQIRSAAGCPCEAGFQLRQTSTGADSLPLFTTLITPTVVTPGGVPGYGTGSVGLTWVFTVTPGLTETFRLVSNITGQSGQVPDMVAYGMITAQYVPFDATGDEALIGTGPRPATAPGGRPPVREPDRSPIRHPGG